jgi:hypothetical protein
MTGEPSPRKRPDGADVQRLLAASKSDFLVALAQRSS